MKRRWDDKNQLSYIEPGALRYDIEDMEFLLPWLPELREGAYPSEPAGGYTESKTPGGSTHAYYETACQVAAELDDRLARTGLDRYIVEDFYCLRLSDADIARKLSLPDREEVRRRRLNALTYIASGRCRRWLNCIDCPEYEKCRQKETPPRKFSRQPVGIPYRQWVRSRSSEIARKNQKHRLNAPEKP